MATGSREEMASKAKNGNSPLLGYNTNVRHKGYLFHIQTEDSGRGHPHVITHLFTQGTILATKKTSYSHLLEEGDWEERVRQLMKDQHKEMFVELRDDAHDEIAAAVLGEPLDGDDVGAGRSEEAPLAKEDAGPAPTSSEGVHVIAPAQMEGASAVENPEAADSPRGRSIFETPDAGGQFGESLISDKSLDEVILTYLKDDLE